MSLTSTTLSPLRREFSSIVQSNTNTDQPTKSAAFEKEFAVASSFAKAVKSSLTPDMASLCESYWTTKLTARFRSLAKFADGRSGYRPFYLTRFGNKLRGFDFNSLSPYKKVFKAKYYVKPGSRKGQVILHFPAFIPTKETKAPEGATNFKISARLLALSDFSFDSIEKTYCQLNKDHHGRYASYESGMLPILKMPMDPITAQLSLDQKEIPDNTSLFLLMSVSFYVYENGRFKHFSKQSCMHLEQVF